MKARFTIPGVIGAGLALHLALANPEEAKQSVRDLGDLTETVVEEGGQVFDATTNQVGQRTVTEDTVPAADPAPGRVAN